MKYKLSSIKIFNFNNLTTVMRNFKKILKIMYYFLDLCFIFKLNCDK